MFWKRQLSLAELNEMGKDTLLSHLDIQFTRCSPDELEATMPVDSRTVQPFGLLHGGASVVLAETLGSVAGYMCTEGEQKVVGVEVNASHLRSARSGRVRGICRPVRCGLRIQVWQIDIFDQSDRLCCTSRLTIAVL